ncbi:MAG: acylphosphatase [Bacteroidales bacterium]|nr:acylphosphatase [Bacteroidales bacterium]
MKKAFQMQVEGRVQGVGFRYYTQARAREAGVFGFVKNMPDGSVYIEAEGEEEAMERFSVWCRQGPAWAKVTRFNLNPQPPCGYTCFEIR